MWFVYFDESKQNNSFFVYSALVLDSDQWNVAFEGIKELRRDLRREHGIYMRQELHAWKFAAGKGQIADRPILKSERAYIFRRLLTFAANPLSRCHFCHWPCPTPAFARSRSSPARMACPMADDMALAQSA
jgi:hypothetical protein